MTSRAAVSKCRSCRSARHNILCPLTWVLSCLHNEIYITTKHNEKTENFYRFPLAFLSKEVYIYLLSICVFLPHICLATVISWLRGDVVWMAGDRESGFVPLRHGTGLHSLRYWASASRRGRWAASFFLPLPANARSWRIISSAIFR